MAPSALLVEERPETSARYDRVVPTDDVRVVDPIDTAFSHGNEAALKAAYDAHGSLIYTFCCRSLPEDRAKDVTQDVFVSAWKAHDRFDPAKGALAGWLIGIAKHRVIDNHRSEGRHLQRRAPADSADLPVESEVNAVGDRMLVAEALDELPDRVRDMIQMAYFDGYTHTEIAERTGRALGTVKSDIRRGLKRVRISLGADS
jgi:RNA polymerase sigma factor (sigma-70 family)